MYMFRSFVFCDAQILSNQYENHCCYEKCVAQYVLYELSRERKKKIEIVSYIYLHTYIYIYIFLANEIDLITILVFYVLVDNELS